MADTVRSYQQAAIVAYELSPWPDPKVRSHQVDAVVLYEIPWPMSRVQLYQQTAIVLHDNTPVASAGPRPMLAQII